MIDYMNFYLASIMWRNPFSNVKLKFKANILKYEVLTRCALLLANVF